MKVIRLINSLDFGGVERRIQLTALQNLIDKKFDLIIVVINNGGRISDILNKYPVDIIFLNESPRIPNFSLLTRLVKLFKEINPSVIHTSGGEANFHGIISGKIAGIPVVVGEEIGYPNHHGIWKYIFRLVYKFSDQLVAISHAVKNNIVTLGEIKPEKISVIYNPVSINQEITGNQNGMQMEDTGGKFVFITVSRMVPVKNLSNLISAFGNLFDSGPQKTIELWLLGDGTDLNALKKQALDLGLGDVVKFWGFQSDVVKFLKSADVFLLPSLSEGFSISLVEAMSCGLPSIVTSIGGPTEIIEEGKTGIFIDPYNQKEISDAMCKFLLMPKEEIQKFKKEAKTASNRYSGELYLKNLEKLYNQLLSK